MPAIDLARLKKQTAQLSDIFDQPAVFLRELREVLEFYINRTLRSPSVAPSSVLPTYRTPVVVLRQVETELGPVAERQPIQALELADALWDEGWLETRLLAAFLLGRIPPQEERLLARLTAWTQAVRDPEVRAALLTTSLTRLRKETPDLFLVLVREWLHPARQRMWSNGIQALVPLISSPDFDNLPPIFEIVEPLLKSSPATLQYDLQELIIVLFEASPDETTYFLQQIVKETKSPLPSIALRRMSPELPQALQASLRETLRQTKTKTR
ncbi:MAG TPA: DNA alkylation repair protein [Anaerolineales bacterium]|nr:DNA alkylation repair protein [Anaerolineales bacterium]